MCLLDDVDLGGNSCLKLRLYFSFSHVYPHKASKFPGTLSHCRSTSNANLLNISYKLNDPLFDEGVCFLNIFVPFCQWHVWLQEAHHISWSLENWASSCSERAGHDPLDLVCPSINFRRAQELILDIVTVIGPLHLIYYGSSQEGWGFLPTRVHALPELLRSGTSSVHVFICIAEWNTLVVFVSFHTSVYLQGAGNLLLSDIGCCVFHAVRC